MRPASTIIFALLIQMGLFGRLVGEGVCCPDMTLEHPHTHGHDHDHFKGVADSANGDCSGDHNSPVRENCPSDCGEHHHHHGTCIHSIQFSLSAEGQYRLAPPHAVSLGCERQHQRAPDGPVMELDKPPLI